MMIIRAFQACLLLLLPLLLGSCMSGLNKNKTDWSVSLDHESKAPYGSSIAYETLPAYFPGARREPLSRWFRYDGVDEQMHASFDSAALLVMLGLDYYVTAEEWLKVLNFARAGNEVFLLCSRLDNEAVRSLGCEKVYGGFEDYALTKKNDGSQAEHALRLRPDTTHTYGFKGRSLVSYFNLRPRADADTLFKDHDGEETNEIAETESRIAHASIDTAVDILGTTSGEPNFIRYSIGNGHITLHSSPLVLSNYFLLQPRNREYLDAIWHAFPANISVVYWNEYFKRSTESSKLSVLMKYPATRWALIIAAATLIVYVLFGLKRLQRTVPIVPPVENASVSFVETVGRLYYNKGAHANLAEKLIQHFLEWVRSNYYMDTSQINDAFAQQLAAKSGKPEAEIAALIHRIHEVRTNSVTVTAEYLAELYRSIQSFHNIR